MITHKTKILIANEVMRPFTTWSNSTDWYLVFENMFTPVHFMSRDLMLRIRISTMSRDFNIADPDSIEQMQKFIKECHGQCLEWVDRHDTDILNDCQIYPLSDIFKRSK